MKFKFYLISLFFIISTIATAQQTLKIGHVNVQELAGKHPSMDSIRAVVEQETADMQQIYEEMLAEHENKLKTFEDESAGYSDFIKTTKQNELMELVQKIQNYNQTAQLQLQQRNRDLIRPIYEEINQEIANIAGADNYSYILDVSAGTVAYVSPESKDITLFVLEAIGGK